MLIEPQTNPDMQGLLADTASSAKTGLLIFAGSNFAVSLIMAQVVQYLWAIINSLQMMVLIVLFNLQIPKICQIILVEIMRLTNLALVDTDSSINMLFNFDESISEPLNERFEEAGYDSTNFFILLGLVLYLILAFIIWNVLLLLMQKCTKNMNNCLTKRLRKKRKIRKTMLVFLLESCSELSLSALICLKSICTDKFSSF